MCGHVDGTAGTCHEKGKMYLEKESRPKKTLITLFNLKSDLNPNSIRIPGRGRKIRTCSQPNVYVY